MTLSASRHFHFDLPITLYIILTLAWHSGPISWARSLGIHLMLPMASPGPGASLEGRLKKRTVSVDDPVTPSLDLGTFGALVLLQLLSLEDSWQHWAGL